MRLAALFLLSAGYLFGQVYTVSTVAGGGLPVNIPATAASIGPAGYSGYVAVDAAGNLYFAAGFAVLRRDAATHILTAAAGNGVPGFGGDGGPAAAAQLSLPGYVAVDGFGNVYIADNCRIREVSGGIINTIAGNGTCGTTGDGGPATSAEIQPVGLAVDSSGNVYVNNLVWAEVAGFMGAPATITGNTIRKISGGTIATVAGNGMCCSGATTTGVPATSVPLNDLGAIAADGAGHVYAVSGDVANVNENAILVWSASSGTLTSIATESSDVAGLAVDSSGNLFLSLPSTPGAIQELSNGVATTLVNLTGPVGIAVDSSGNLYIGQPASFSIAEFSHGALTTVAGNGQFSYSGDGGPATSAQLYGPMALAWASGNLYIADQNSVIREVSNGIITTVPGTSGGVLSNADGVAVDASGNLFIADFGNNRIAELSQGVLSTLAAGHAADVAVDAAGNVYAGVGSSIVEIANGAVTTLGAVNPQANAVAVDSTGAVYFTDPWNIPPVPNQWDLQFNGVFRDSPDLGSISLLVDHLVLPNGLAFSPDEGVLYINDSRRRHIRAFDVMPNGLLAKQTERVFVDLAGTEPGGPDGMKVDTAGNVYCGGPGGIYIMDPKGNKLGRIVHGQPQTTNMAFGGDDWKTLFFTTHSTFGSVRVKIAGVPVPAPKRS